MNSTNSKLLIWIRAVRAPFLTASIIPVILGLVLAWYNTNLFNWWNGILCLLGAMLLHSGGNLANDYFDNKSGADNVQEPVSNFAGGSRIIQNGLLTPKEIISGSLICLLLGSLIGLYLNWISPSNIILILGIIGVLSAWFYTATPLPISHSGLGELLIGLNFGPLLVLGAYYVQTGKLNLSIFLISLPIALLITTIIYINEFPDYIADKTAGKNTLIVRLGLRKAIWGYYILLLLIYLTIILGIFYKYIPIYALFTLLTLPLTIKAIIVAKSHFEEPAKLVPANGLTVLLHIIIGILLSVSYVLDKLFV